MDQKSSSLSIQDMDIEERPRERLERLGAGKILDRELMAILLRTGVKGLNAVVLGGLLIKQFGGLRGLHEASFEDLKDVHGLGRAKAAQIKAAFELGHRMTLEESKEKSKIESPEDVYKIFWHDLSIEKQEQLWVLALSTRNEIIRKQLLYIGTVNHSSVRMGEVFEIPVRCKAVSIILIHNHPSGNPAPSSEDIRFTEELVKAGNLMDVGVLDHIIIAKEGFTSIRGSGKVVFSMQKPKFWH